MHQLQGKYSTTTTHIYFIISIVQTIVYYTVLEPEYRLIRFYLIRINFGDLKFLLNRYLFLYISSI